MRMRRRPATIAAGAAVEAEAAAGRAARWPTPTRTCTVRPMAQTAAPMLMAAPAHATLSTNPTTTLANWTQLTTWRIRMRRLMAGPSTGWIVMKSQTGSPPWRLTARRRRWPLVMRVPRGGEPHASQAQARLRPKREQWRRRTSGVRSNPTCPDASTSPTRCSRPRTMVTLRGGVGPSSLVLGACAHWTLPWCVTGRGGRR
mmetsp:Transcript_77021/g.221239  ORF Transcript_77021/g.221239 Transcript_77021/m.221239 type:complete len:201 (+) Transcript_77021:324-926(+)